MSYNRDVDWCVSQPDTGHGFDWLADPNHDGTVHYNCPKGNITYSPDGSLVHTTVTYNEGKFVSSTL